MGRNVANCESLHCGGFGASPSHIHPIHPSRKKLPAGRKAYGARGIADLEQ